jgi:hypothetical protein
MRIRIAMLWAQAAADIATSKAAPSTPHKAAPGNPPPKAAVAHVGVAPLK